MRRDEGEPEFIVASNYLSSITITNMSHDSLEQHADIQQRLLHDHDLRGDPVGFPGQLTIRAGRNYVHSFLQFDYEGYHQL